jgi:hypothetical protein
MMFSYPARQAYDRKSEILSNDKNCVRSHASFRRALFVGYSRAVGTEARAAPDEAGICSIVTPYSRSVTVEYRDRRRKMAYSSPRRSIYGLSKIQWSCMDGA